MLNILTSFITAYFPTKTRRIKKKDPNISVVLNSLKLRTSFISISNIIMDTTYQHLVHYQKMCNTCKRNFDRKFNSYARYLNILNQKIDDSLKEYTQFKQYFYSNLNNVMNNMQLMNDMSKRISLINIKMRKRSKLWNKYAKKICLHNIQ